MPDFVIQGGDPEGTGRGGPGYTIPDETVVGQYGRGVVAMARTPQPDSQGSQFFIVLDDGARPALEQYRTYVIFGEVVSGMDVVDQIAAMPNSGPPRQHGHRPGGHDVGHHPGAEPDAGTHGDGRRRDAGTPAPTPVPTPGADGHSDVTPAPTPTHATRRHAGAGRASSGRPVSPP